MRIDSIEPRAVAPRLDDEGPQMYVSAKHVRAPGDDQLGMAELLGLGAVAVAQRLHHARGSGGRANRTIQSRSPQAVEESPVHAAALQKSHGAAVAVR